MKLKARSLWLWLPLLFVAVVLGGVLYVRQGTVNAIHPALDKLSKLSFSQRWSDPEMLKIRALGEKALPNLRRVLREKDSATTRSLLWIKTNWPGVTKLNSHFPDLAKLRERRATACQVIQSLGPAARSAAPDLIAILKSQDMRDLNSATMALGAIGIDADICDQLDAVMEAGVTNHVENQIVMMLASVKPPSARTLKVLVTALSSPSPYLQNYAAVTLGHLGVTSPGITTALKHLQTTTSDPLALVSSMTAIWDLEKNLTNAAFTLFPIMEKEIINYKPFWGGGSGGQGVDTGEQVFMAATDLLSKIKLDEREKAETLRLCEAYGEKTGRIFIRMLLLPSMIQLGFPAHKCFDVCRTGLDAPEDYYRKQAAGLLFDVTKKFPDVAFDLNDLLRDQDVGVRVSTAKVHWFKNHNAKVVVPILIESLDRSKYQSYYYPQIQSSALKLLGEIGPNAHDAIEPLNKVLRDPDPAVAKLASETLSKIRK